METRQERTFKAAVFFGDFIPLEIAAGREDCESVV
jgi:hypothetical protein